MLCLGLVLGLVGPGGADAAEQDGAAPSEAAAGDTRGDYVHISSTAPPAASAHGWWVYPEPTDLQADVTVQLQVNRAGGWVNVGGPGVERVRAGGGSANRSNARVECAGPADTQWRSVVDVDVVGHIDSPGKLYTPARPLRCGA